MPGVIDQNGLFSALNNAKRLMTPEADNYKPVSRDHGYDTSYLNEDVGYSTTTQMEQYPQMYQAQRPVGVAGKNLPAAIRESMMNNPIQVPSNGLTGSVLDNMPRQAPRSIPVVTENRQIINGNGGNGVDYGVIKSLIDESVRRHMDELKGALTENTKKGNTNSLGVMKMGEKFQFLDNKGNLYEAQLKFVKNINKK